MQLDETFLASLPPELLPVWDQFQLRGVRMSYRRFPYEILDISGKVQIDTRTGRLTFDGLRGLTRSSPSPAPALWICTARGPFPTARLGTASCWPSAPRFPAVLNVPRSVDSAPCPAT